MVSKECSWYDNTEFLIKVEVGGEMIFEEQNRLIAVKKDEVLYGNINITTVKKAFVTNGTREFVSSDLGEIKNYLDTHNLST